ncbi:MAG: hypothetical protein AUJ28_00930 [Parcubacteria group bacterium CG1_02_37_51]|nr:MAG: hypothetical protein AUJ28_00930 [Parcubacteria group bacterium CG1_02_37_51]
MDDTFHSIYSNKEYIYVKPNIIELSDSMGYVGGGVTIYGSYFGEDIGQVTVNNEDATPTYSFAWDDNEVFVEIPNTTSGNIVLTNSDGISSEPVYINITVPECTSSSWSCDSWSDCTSNNIETRTCNKVTNCEGGTSSPATTQSCTYIPACSSDTWQCGSWSTCLPQGVQTRSCNKIYDCPSAETASPQTSQYCQPAAQPQQYQNPNEQVNISQSTILKATLKLICPLDSKRASQGSGTIINSDGTILTNKHVVDGTLGCLVGFIDGANDQPYFSDRHIADITKVSSSSDIAILKLRNPNKSNLTAINITTGNSNVVNLGNKITTYGYPADFGEKITYTSGDFSGYNGDYLKTTAILEHGNSGGGAYLANGTFIGIPSAVISGSLNSMGLVLSINKINSWMNNTSLARDDSNNSYARVSSLLEDIDLNTLYLFEFTESDSQSDNVVIENNETLDRERSSMTKIDRQLSSRLKGKILLQVESVGEAWYVSPDDSRKYYMKDGDTAYEMLRQFGLGITDADIAKIPVGIETRFADTDSDGDGLADQLEEGLKTDPYKSDTDSDGVSDGDEILKNNTNPLGSGVLTYNSSLNSRLRGKILLQVESKGEAWYLNPDDGKRYYMKHGGAAYQIMRYLSLGITNNDLRKIDIGEID